MWHFHEMLQSVKNHSAADRRQLVKKNLACSYIRKQPCLTIHILCRISIVYVSLQYFEKVLLVLTMKLLILVRGNFYVHSHKAEIAKNKKLMQ